MDKYEYRVKTEQMLEYMEKKNYKKAMEIADTIDWRRVKSVSMLNSVSEIYEYNGEFQKSWDILFVAHDRSPESRKIIYRLGILALKINDTEEASECYEEFIKLAPKDPNQYILKYKILKARRSPIAEQIEALEQFKKAEYVEKWAYELASLYHAAGMASECLEECDDLILWFSEGKYVYQAMELKMQYKPLTPLQQEKYNNRNLQSEQEELLDEGDESDDEEAKAEESMEADTAEDVQSSLSESDESEPEKGLSATQELAYTIAATASRALRPGNDDDDDIDMEKTRKMPDAEELEKLTKKNDADGIRTTVKGATLAEALANGVALANGLDIDAKAASQKDEEMRITGQMKIDEILQEWESKQKVNAEAIEDQKQKDEEILLEKRKEAERRKVEEARRIEEQQRAAEEARRIAQQKAAEEARRLAKKQAEEARLKAAKKAEEERLLAEQKAAEEERLLERLASGRSAEEAQEPETDDTDEIKESDKVEADEVYEEIESDDIVSEEASEEIESDEIVSEEAYEEIESDDIVSEEAASSDIQSDDAEKTERPELTGMTADLRQLMDELEQGKSSLSGEADYEEADLEDDFAVYDEDDYDEGDFEDADDYSEADFGEEEDYDDIDDFFDDDEEEEPEEEEPEEEPVVEEPASVEELEIEEPTEEEIQKRIKKGKGGVPFDTGFVVTGRYDLSATSEIGLKAGLTEEQKKLFSYFVPVRGMSEQIVEVLDNDRREQREGTSRTGNILVIGHKGSGKTVLAVDIVKAIQKQRNLKQGKVAIVTGESLNKKELANIIQKLRGGAIIIEKAGRLNTRTVKELSHLMEKKTGELLFVLEDQRKALERLFTANPDFKRKFTSRLELPVFVNDELVTFGQTYAKENGYKLDEMGILALYSRIDVLQREDHSVTVAEVKEMMDEAIDHSQKANVKHLARRVFGKGTDDSDRIILKEEDFKN